MTAQILAAVIFVGMFALIIMDKFERQYVTLGSAALVLVVVFGICMHSWDAIKNALNLGAIFRADFWYGASESASSGVNWSTIFFITGMMIMVEGLGKSGFFRWLCLSLAKLAHYHVVPLLLCFMAMSAFLAMFIDSITVVLFLATVTLELAQILCFDPVPMILSEVFCANLGGAATMCGDPPNIIIGTALGYTFTDFIKNTGVIIGTVVVTIMTIVQRFYRNLLGREGYLMHTLPVTETQLVTSKLISSTVWSLCSILAACLSFGILAVLMMADMDLLEQLPLMWSGIREAFARCNMEFWEALAFSGVVSFVRMVSAIACIYAACMVGHQFKNHPALAGILSFFVMQYLQGWLEKLLQIGTGVYETTIYSAVGDMGSIEAAVSALGYMESAMVTLGVAAAFGVFWFGLTVWLMRNKLNLE